MELSHTLLPSHTPLSLSHAPGQTQQHTHPNRSSISDAHRRQAQGTHTETQRHTLLSHTHTDVNAGVNMVPPAYKAPAQPLWLRTVGRVGCVCWVLIQEVWLYGSHFLPVPTSDSAPWRSAGLGSVERWQSSSAGLSVS